MMRKTKSWFFFFTVKSLAQLNILMMCYFVFALYFTQWSAIVLFATRRCAYSVGKDTISPLNAYTTGSTSCKTCYSIGNHLNPHTQHIFPLAHPLVTGEIELYHPQDSPPSGLWGLPCLSRVQQRDALRRCEWRRSCFGTTVPRVRILKVTVL